MIKIILDTFYKLAHLNLQHFSIFAYNEVICIFITFESMKYCLYSGKLVSWYEIQIRGGWYEQNRTHSYDNMSNFI